MGVDGNDSMVITVDDRASGLDCGGEEDIEARCLSNRLLLRLSISICSSSSALFRSSEACLAKATADTFLDLPLRCDGGGGF